MSRRFISLLSFMLVLQSAAAQIPVNDRNDGMRLRLSALAEKQLTDRLKLQGGSEVRLYDNILSERRLEASAGVSYTMAKHCEAEAAVSYIGKKEYSESYTTRWRFSLGLDEKFKMGRMKLTVKESVMMTHRPGGMNTWQNPRNALDLNASLKLKYKGRIAYHPYVSADVRVRLNGPRVSGYEYDSGTRQYVVAATGDLYGEPGWFLDGFDDVSVSRIRGTAGVERAVGRRSKLKLFVQEDCRRSLSVDADKKGCRLKSLVYDTSSHTCFGVGWTFDL